MLTMTDLFAGAGGSSTGALAVPGITVRMAANHWALAVETHNINHPDTDHACADLSQVDPRYFPGTDLLWASPECTNHSGAGGRKRATGQGDLFEPLPDEAAERSRATMWDVVRFTEHHRYAAVVVENVIEACDWAPFRAWLAAMDALGYHHQTVFLNSMHAQATGLPAPQSRDRLYVVFHQHGNPAPDVRGMQRPRAWCPACAVVVPAVQTWKDPTKTTGRYRRQYLYRCPHRACRHQVVEPGWLPAASVIDWTDPGSRIGDRPRPLAASTRARIAAGIARYWTAPLAVPVEGRAGKDATTTDGPLRTQTTRAETAIALPFVTVHRGGPGECRTRTTDQPLTTQTASSNHHGIATPPGFLAELRGGASDARAATEPLAAVTAGGNHHGLVVPYYRTGTATPTGRPVPTLTTVDRHALVMPTTPPGPRPAVTPQALADADAAVDDTTFRMLQPAEVAAAMAFPTTYRLLGTRAEQVRQAGNAVTPPTARDLLTAVAASLNHTTTTTGTDQETR
jgi:DNA (cytosine-5)-methyltransferase 1